MNNIEYLKKYLKRYTLEQGIELLNKGIPVQYIVGQTNFYGYDFFINKNTLIPRFETEELVEKTLKILKNKFNNKITIADICTGSGCIGITLALELNTEVDVTDISVLALEVAQKNKEHLKANVNIFKGNLLEPLNKKYNCIISNPPYIKPNEKIMEIVKNNEPHLALYADNEGLYYYDEILKNINNYLEKNFLVALEIGSTQAEHITKLINKYMKNMEIKIEKDVTNCDRFIFITNQA